MEIRTGSIRWVAVGIAIALASLAGAEVDAQTMTSDPDSVRLEVEDLRRFSQLYSSLGGMADTAAVVERDYLGHASPGLRAYAGNFGVTGATIASALATAPNWYEDLDSLPEAILAKEDELRAGFRELKSLFPGAVFPPVWFVVGGHGPRGQASPVGALIGAEGLGARSEIIAPLVLHELAHFQSAMVQGVEQYRRIYSDAHRTLLALALREGSAEFIAWLATGSHTNPAAEQFGLDHEVELWEKFSAEMRATDAGDWMFVTPTNGVWPPNLGYWIGFRIVQSYYEYAADQHTAIRDILALTDFEEFLAASGYAERLGVCAGADLIANQ